MLLEHQRIRRIYQLLEGANSSQATACRKSLSVYVCLVNVAFVAAGLSVLPQRHTLLDMILSALRECCMLMAILIYMAMPLPTVLGHSNRKDRCSWTLAAIFPALLAMLVFPVVRHDAICAGNLHCYLFGLCKVAMILSYQWFQSIFADSTLSTSMTSSTSKPTTSSLSNGGWRSERLKGSKVLRFATMKSSKDEHLREAPPAWLFGCIDIDLDEMDLV